MRLTDLNRQGGIGANSLCLELGNFRFVLDAGMHPKIVGQEAVPDFDRLRGLDIDFVLLTHCHLDHLGSLPLLMKHLPGVQIFLTQSSMVLAERMLRNSVNVMKRQREELGLPGFPLYTQSDVNRLADHWHPLVYGAPRQLHKSGESIQITLFPAGHIAGAAGVEIIHQHRKLFFTGDVLFTSQLTIPGARFPRGKYDTVVLETTRGATPSLPELTRESEGDRLLATINRVIKRGGSCLIPVFALGRTQEILTLLRNGRREGKLTKSPIFGAGLGMELVDYLDALGRRDPYIQFNRQVIRALRVQPLARDLPMGISPKERGIYVLSSGMMVENTPSYKMAANLLSQHRNAICFVGYCDPDTPGGKLLNSRRGDIFSFDTLDFQCERHCDVERFELSGHADREELLEFALQTEARSLVLTHGDPAARSWFQEQLRHQAPDMRVIDPKPLVPVEV